MNNNFIKVCVFTEGLKKNTYAYASLEAFAHGVTNTGDDALLITKRKYEPCDVAVIFGDVRDAKGKEKRMPFKAEIKGRHIHRGLIVIDTAILTRSSELGVNYRRIGIDGLLNDEADFNNNNCLDDRWKNISKATNITIQPWNKEGKHIVFALQRPLDASLKGSPTRRPDNYKNWIINTVQMIKENSDRPIHIRPHPGSLIHYEELNWLSSLRAALGDQIEWDESDQKFNEIIQDCWICVTYNSGAGVDAALAGVPVLAGNSGSFAWDVAIHDPAQIESPSYPDRSGWLNNLSYVEWSLDEMRQGLPWKHLREKVMAYI